jgi:thiosulfate dehydrogenase (quinone) large subunit
MATSSRALSGWLAALRIYTGFFWATHGIDKLRSSEWAAPNGMMAQIVSGMTKDTSGPYHDFIANVVMPNSVLFAHLVAWGETLVGVALFFGLLTKVGGFGGAFLALNYLVAKDSLGTWNAWTGLDGAAIALSLACAVLPVSNTFALDALLFRRRRG